MTDDYFDMKLALNPETGNVVASAEAQVYAIEDTTFSTPLQITDMSDIPLASLIASPTGIYPQFKVTTGEERVMAKAGTMVTPLTSAEGSRGPKGDPGDSGVVDPTNSQPGFVLTSNGPTTPPSWLPPVAGGAGVATLYESPLGSGLYPPRGTASQTRVDWVGVEQPALAEPTSGVDFVTTATAMSGFDFFHRVMVA